ECRRLRDTSLPEGLPTGQAVATGAGKLHASWVIHTVGPNARAGQTDPDLLASCFRSSLDVAQEVGAESVAFPAISAGVYGWSVGRVAGVGVGTLEAWRSANADGGVQLVRFVRWDQSARRRSRVASTPHEPGPRPARTRRRG